MKHNIKIGDCVVFNENVLKDNDYVRKGLIPGVTGKIERELKAFEGLRMVLDTVPSLWGCEAVSIRDSEVHYLTKVEPESYKLTVDSKYKF